MTKQAMIFAAGMGTRLKPITDTMPKALVPVAGKPLLQHVIEKLRAADFQRIVVNVHHFADQIEKFLSEQDNFGIDIRISDERERLLETGGGIKRARTLLDTDSPVLIHNVDILSNVHLETFFQEAEGNDATLLVSERQTKRYLLFHPEETVLRGWTNIETGEVRSPYQDIEVAQHRMLAFSGIHVIGPRLLKEMDSWEDYFGIMDFYLKNCDRYKIKGHVQEGLRLLDVGKSDSLKQAELFYETI